MNDYVVPRPDRPRFFDICLLHQIDVGGLQIIADLSGVPGSTVEAMFVGTPVERVDALRVLSFLSQMIRVPLSLESMNVPLIIPDTEVHCE
jgi:hypothetical protein